MIVNGSANDNEVLELSEDLPILILGGSRSGISVQAEQIIEVIYLSEVNF